MHTTSLAVLLLLSHSCAVLAGWCERRLYVMMVALSQFHLSNVHTLSIIFARDLARPDWRAARAADARRMLAAFLKN